MKYHHTEITLFLFPGKDDDTTSVIMLSRKESSKYQAELIEQYLLSKFKKNQVMVQHVYFSDK